MADVLEFLSRNAGGFISGGVVAVLQLIVVYLWIDRRVEKVQLKSEARKWKEARLELDATLLSLASSLARPLAYYTQQSERGVYFRENFRSALQHVIDKSASLDMTLAIYSIGLEPDSFTQITQLADRLRSVANYAGIAQRNFGQIETRFTSIEDKNARHIGGLKRQNRSIEFHVPRDPQERSEKLFGYYLLLQLDEIAEIVTEFAAVAQRTCDAATLDQGTRFTRLRRISKGELSAVQSIEALEQDTATLRAAVRKIETNGILFAYAPEVD